jgi:hypothetical protein
MFKTVIGWRFAFALAYVVPCFKLLGGIFELWTGSDYFVDAYRSASWRESREGSSVLNSPVRVVLRDRVTPLATIGRKSNISTV